MIGNVALGKPATQIGTYVLSPYVFTADLAVDGNTDPNALRNSCSHPNSYQQNIPCWWYVELGGVYSIKQVILYNRQDAHSACKISTLTIVFSQSPFSITSDYCILLLNAELLWKLFRKSCHL